MFECWDNFCQKKLVVGAGLSGSVIAQQASERSGFKVLVLDKRDHIGGNCFDYIDRHGIRVRGPLND